MKQRVLVSACLLGERVRWDGSHRRYTHPVLLRWIAEDRIVPVCPEVLGGLTVPRLAAEMVAHVTAQPGDELPQWRVVDSAGNTVTDAFLSGACAAVEMAARCQITVAVLKDASPSCGSTTVYDGTFSGQRIDGEGIAAVLLRRAGVAVYSEDQFTEADAYLQQ